MSGLCDAVAGQPGTLPPCELGAGQQGAGRQDAPGGALADHAEYPRGGAAGPGPAREGVEADRPCALAAGLGARVHCDQHRRSEPGPRYRRHGDAGGHDGGGGQPEPAAGGRQAGGSPGQSDRRHGAESEELAGAARRVAGHRGDPAAAAHARLRGPDHRAAVPARRAARHHDGVQHRRLPGACQRARPGDEPGAFAVHLAGLRLGRRGHHRSGARPPAEAGDAPAGL
mmetsp:Transcript_48747/g.122640  ORF Transcript_48747/g.122640 Transcript_48747/m.122640 type:complete len:228 (+) Transcript_48747:3531-4214(+)